MGQIAFSVILGRSVKEIEMYIDKFVLDRISGGHCRQDNDIHCLNNDRSKKVGKKMNFLWQSKQNGKMVLTKQKREYCERQVGADSEKRLNETGIGKSAIFLRTYSESESGQL